MRRFGRKLHVMGATKFFLVEVDAPLLLEFLAVPAEQFEKLFVISAFFVPIGQQATGDVDALAIPALADHVDLFSGGLFIHLLGRFRIGQVEQACLSVHEGIDPKTLAIGSDRDINR